MDLHAALSSPVGQIDAAINTAVVDPETGNETTAIVPGEGAVPAEGMSAGDMALEQDAAMFNAIAMAAARAACGNFAVTIQQLINKHAIGRFLHSYTTNPPSSYKPPVSKKTGKPTHAKPTLGEAWKAMIEFAKQVDPEAAAQIPPYNEGKNSRYVVLFLRRPEGIREHPSYDQSGKMVRPADNQTRIFNEAGYNANGTEMTDGQKLVFALSEKIWQKHGYDLPKEKFKLALVAECTANKIYIDGNPIPNLALAAPKEAAKPEADNNKPEGEADNTTEPEESSDESGAEADNNDPDEGAKNPDAVGERKARTPEGAKAPAKISWAQQVTKPGTDTTPQVRRGQAFEAEFTSNLKKIAAGKNLGDQKAREEDQALTLRAWDAATDTVREMGVSFEFLFVRLLDKAKRASRKSKESMHRVLEALTVVSDSTSYEDDFTTRMLAFRAALQISGDPKTAPQAEGTTTEATAPETVEAAPVNEDLPETSADNTTPLECPLCVYQDAENGRELAVLTNPLCNICDPMFRGVAPEGFLQADVDSFADAFDPEFLAAVKAAQVPTPSAE
jgi:hypothetical protein